MSGDSYDLPVSVIRSAHEAIRSKVLLTPLVELAGHRTAGGHRVLLKAECLQPTGSFKVRGASYRLTTLTAAERAAGVVAYSTGNHAQAVARAAGDIAVKASIVMSPDVPPSKIEATRRWGAEIIMTEPSSAVRRTTAERLAADTGAILVAPYDDLSVMAGQGTIGLEILDQLSADLPAAVFVPIGGGGLLAGIASAIKQVAPSVAVIGVEPELENDAWRSFHSGALTSLPGPSASIADAIKIQELGRLTFPLIRRFADDVVTVSEAQIAAACLLCAGEAHLVVEPAGAVAVAGALAYTDTRVNHMPVVAVAAGGNIGIREIASLAAIATGSVEANETR